MNLGTLAENKSMNLELIITKGQQAGQRKAIHGPQKILIGRDANCDFTITDPLLSRQHCLIEVTNNGLKVIDLQSRNGTFVNGQRIGEKSLSFKDEVKVGRHSFQVKQPTSQQEAPKYYPSACPDCPEKITEEDIRKMRAIRYGDKYYCRICIERGIEPEIPQQTAFRSQSPLSAPVPSYERAGNFSQQQERAHPQPAKAKARAKKESGGSGFSKLGPYEILQVLGEGGMGAVYKARHSFLETIVALKVIKEELASQPDIVKRFLQEAKLGVSLDHENILKIHDAGEYEGIYFFSMEFFAGQDISNYLKKHGKIPPAKLLQLSIQMADALAYAHSKRVIHRDVKPSNVMLDEHDHVKLADFGLAKAWQKAGAHRLTASGQMLGTIQYMSPEQLEDARNVNPQTDIFSLGATLYFALTGFPPFGEDPLGKVIENILHNDPPPLKDFVPNMPEEFEQIILKALAKKNNKRFATMADMRDALIHYAKSR